MDNTTPNSTHPERYEVICATIQAFLDTLSSLALKSFLVSGT